MIHSSDLYLIKGIGIIDRKTISANSHNWLYELRRALNLKQYIVTLNQILFSLMEFH